MADNRRPEETGEKANVAHVANRARKQKQKRKTPWTAEVQACFLEKFAECGIVTKAAAAAGINPRTAYRHREEDEEFRELWAEAEEKAVDALEAEARRRATKGYQEPVYYQGKQVGEITKYSDRMLELLLKGHRPERYSDKLRLAGHDGREIVVRVVE